MANLQYRTRGSASPQGKPRVYFLGHLADHELHFEQVSAWVLKHQNCAVWYGNGAEEELKQMQLFVVPVTEKLLSGDDARAKFHFAAEHHIPVLPILMEPGLEERFNENWEDTQYLDPYSYDNTGLTFDEKLKRFLDQVLIGDELAARIRAAFDGYIFLSYRKKDRSYAQRLMRLIHRNEFCRDLAIWYDEFLVPGENFNSAIHDALQKSSLFVLTVTPNLVNESNYISAVEYPMAVEEGKNIVPVEMVVTDRAALEEQYRDIPACADPSRELPRVLMEALEGVALQKNSADAEHNYCIGLAYLGGVDVEVDHERALELITFAAEAGLTEAIDKLVEMYSTGMGVARCYDTAVRWQREKIRVLEERYHNQGGAEILYELVLALGDCCNRLSALERLNEAEECCQKGLELLDKFACLNEPKMLQASMLLYGTMGDICLAQGKLSEARQAYHKSMEYIDAQPLAQATEADRINRTIVMEKIGDLHYTMGELQDARIWYERSAREALVLLEENASPLSRRNLLVKYALMGKLCYKEGKLSQAREWYEKSVQLSSSLAEELGTQAARRDRMVACGMLGRICLLTGDLEAAENWCIIALELSLSLAEETETVIARRDLAKSYVDLGDIHAKKNELTQAGNCYQHSYTIIEALVARADTVANHREQWSVCTKLGELYRNSGDLNEARRWHEKAAGIISAFVDELKVLDSWTAASLTCKCLGLIEKQAGNREDARYWFDQEYRINRDLARLTDDPHQWALFAASCLNFAWTYERVEEQYQYWCEAMEVLEQLCCRCPDETVYKDSLKTVREMVRLMEQNRS